MPKLESCLRVKVDRKTQAKKLEPSPLEEFVKSLPEAGEFDLAALDRINEFARGNITPLSERKTL